MAADAGGYSEDTSWAPEELALGFALSAAGSFFGSHALAQIGTTAVAPPVPPGSKAGLSAEDKKAKSAECSKQADTKVCMASHGKSSARNA